MKTSSKIISACLLLFACNNNNKEGNVKIILFSIWFFAIFHYLCTLAIGAI